MSSVFQELDGLAPQGYYEDQLDRIRNRGSSISNNFQGGVPSMQGGNAGDIGDWMDFYNRQKSVIWDGQGNQIGFNHGYGKEERWDPQQPGDDKWISDEEMERIRYDTPQEKPIGVRPPDVDPNRDTSRDIDMGPIPMPIIDDQRPSPTDEGWNSQGPGTSPSRGQIENILREGYQNVLGRDADAEGLKYWTDQVMANPDERGYGRAIQDAMDNINRSEESINRTNYSEGDRYSKDELDRRRQIINREDYINRDDSRSFDSKNYWNTIRRETPPIDKNLPGYRGDGWNMGRVAPEYWTDEEKRRNPNPGYGGRIGMDPDLAVTMDFQDQDGDGTDDRNQRGPGQPYISWEDSTPEERGKGGRKPGGRDSRIGPPPGGWRDDPGVGAVADRGKGYLTSRVKGMYENLLGREADQEGLNYWVNQALENPDPWDEEKDGLVGPTKYTQALDDIERSIQASDEYKQRPPVIKEQDPPGWRDDPRRDDPWKSPFPPGWCPTPDMKILLSDKSQKPAGELKVGDEVRTAHEEDFTIGNYKVSRVELVDSPIVQLNFEGKSITCSPTHQFYSETDDKWITAEDLKEGDRVALEDGEVALIGRQRMPDGKVVSITVDDAHTYFCEGFLCHNKTLAPEAHPDHPDYDPNDPRNDVPFDPDAARGLPDIDAARGLPDREVIDEWMRRRPRRRPPHGDPIGPGRPDPIGPGRPDPGNPNQDAIEQFYRTELGRDADREGMDYWMGRAKDGMSLDEIKKSFQQSEEAKKRRTRIDESNPPRVVPFGGQPHAAGPGTRREASIEPAVAYRGGRTPSREEHESNLQELRDTEDDWRGPLERYGTQRNKADENLGRSIPATPQREKRAAKKRAEVQQEQSAQRAAQESVGRSRRESISQPTPTRPKPSAEPAPSRPVKQDTGSFLDNVYQKELGRAADQGGKDYWAKEISSGRQTRDQVVANIRRSSEYQGRNK